MRLILFESPAAAFRVITQKIFTGGNASHSLWLTGSQNPGTHCANCWIFTWTMPNPGTENEFRTQKIHKMSLRHETNKKTQWRILLLWLFLSFRVKSSSCFQTFHHKCGLETLLSSAAGFLVGSAKGASRSSGTCEEWWVGVPRQGMSLRNPSSVIPH